MSKKNKGSAINTIFIILILTGILTALGTGSYEEVTKASFDAAKGAVNLAIGLVGAMALWLGLMKVAEKAGLLLILARKLKPVMTKLFPDVPSDHPAMSAMIMNIASNVLGLGNAATPFGIKAMEQLNKLNPLKGTATNAMCLFLAINTSSVTLLPLGVIAIRASAGAGDPAGILLPSILATLCSTVVAIFMSKLLAKRSTDENFQDENDSPEIEESLGGEEPLKSEGWRRICMPGYLLAFIAAVIYHLVIQMNEGVTASDYFLKTFPQFLIPFLIGIFVVYGLSRKVPVYETICEGAKEGFNVALRIIPFLVTILVAISIFRSSGALDLLIKLVEPITSLIGMPADTLPMALIRPLSGSGAFGVMSDLVTTAPDSKSSFIASIMQGSTETTFYVLAVYFGSAGITKARHAIAAALMADLAGIMAAVLLGNIFYTG